MELKPGGFKKKLSRMFIDEKVPGDFRHQLPVLAEGSHVLWVPGWNRSSGTYWITRETEKIVAFEWECEED